MDQTPELGVADLSRAPMPTAKTLVLKGHR
jgi:hypothetical protein